MYLQTIHGGAFMYPFLPWEKNPVAKFYWSPYSEVVCVVRNIRHCIRHCIIHYIIFLGVLSVIFLRIIKSSGAWGGVVVKALRYYSDGLGIDSLWCH